jgi:hypothetical protein
LVHADGMATVVCLQMPDKTMRVLAGERQGLRIFLRR